MKSLFSNRRTPKLSLLCLGILVARPVLGQGPGQQAELVFHNGKIVTVDPRFSVAEAVAIRDQRFSAVGRSSEVLKLAGPSTLVIDLKGKTVIPGLIDTHRHIQMEAERAYGAGVEAPKLDRKSVV